MLRKKGLFVSLLALVFQLWVTCALAGDLDKFSDLEGTLDIAAARRTSP